MRSARPLCSPRFRESPARRAEFAQPGVNPPSYTHLGQWWDLAPLGAKACSQGREPLGAEAQINPRAPEGRRRSAAPMKIAVAPPGLSGIRWPSFLHAWAPTEPSSQGARLVYKRVGVNPRVGSPPRSPSPAGPACLCRRDLRRGVGPAGLRKVVGGAGPGVDARLSKFRPAGGSRNGP
jgi:hypothetical protein